MSQTSPRCGEYLSARVPALVLHLLAGLVAGTIFGAQILAILAPVVLVEAVASFITRGVAAGLVWLPVSQIALQIGYLGGIYLRGILERVGIIVAAQPSRRS
jgi:hypothetical protein